MPATLNYLTVRDALPAVVITLNRPEQLNALSTGLMKELIASRGGRRSGPSCSRGPAARSPPATT
jgi:hypothetical protein